MDYFESNNTQAQIPLAVTQTEESNYLQTVQFTSTEEIPATDLSSFEVVLSVEESEERMGTAQDTTSLASFLAFREYFLILLLTVRTSARKLISTQLSAQTCTGLKLLFRISW